MRCGDDDNQPVGFDGRVFRHTTNTGVERYAREVYAGIVRAVDARLFVPRSGNRYAQHIWTQCGLPLLAARARVATLFCPVMDAPVRLPRRIRLAVTIHDVGFWDFPDLYSPAFRFYYQSMLPPIARRADRVICISRAAEATVTARLPGAVGKTTVVHHGIGKDFRCQDLPRRPVILCVGALYRHKNVTGVVEAFRQLCERIEHKLVVVGAPQSAVSSAEPVHRAVARLPPQRVELLGHVSDEVLLRLYNEAELLVHASFMEGFGFVPIEAMACGCPTVVSDIAVLREVCGDAALFCDPSRPEDIAAKMLELISDARRRDSLRAAGLRQAAQFSWERCAAETLRAITGRDAAATRT